MSPSWSGTGPMSARAWGSVTFQPWAMYVTRSVRSVANRVGDCPLWEFGSLPRKVARMVSPYEKPREGFLVHDGSQGSKCQRGHHLATFQAPSTPAPPACVTVAGAPAHARPSA